MAERFPDAVPVIDAAQAVRHGGGVRVFTSEERHAVENLMTVLAEQIRRTGAPDVPAWRRAAGTDALNAR